MARYYELPIDFERLMHINAELPTCDLKQSIAQNIYLIITSKHRENRYDESYGCTLWELDFELVYDENMWLENIRNSVYNSVVKHETRLYDTTVEIDVTQDDKVATLKDTKTVKSRLTIYVKGYITETGAPFSFDTDIYLSPLSLD